MTQRTLVLVPLLAFALVLAPQMRLTAIAQDKDNSEKSEEDSSQSNSNQKQQGSSQNNALNSNQANESPSSQNNDASSNNSGRDSDNNDAALPSPSDSGNNYEKKRSDDRSVLTDQNRNESTSKTTDRTNDKNARTDNRDNARNDRQRDFRQDFKFGQTASRGLTINSVVRNSIFYRSGLRDGDIIVSYNRHPIRRQDDFARFVVYQPGQRIPVVVLRNGREETIYVVYENDVAQSRSSAQVYFGAEFDPQASDLAVIIRVDEGSPADRAGLQRDDVVLSLNDERVSNGQDAMQVIGSMNPGQRLEVEFSRHARTEVVLGDPGRPAATTGAYQQGYRGAEIGVGVSTETRGSDSDRDQNTRDRRSDRREGRGILPRFRN
jgi:C-terminal processing protease CtpA/Prc